MTRDNLPRPNYNIDGKADNKQQALFYNTNTRRFKIQTGDMGHPPGRTSLYLQYLAEFILWNLIQ